MVSYAKGEGDSANLFGRIEKYCHFFLRNTVQTQTPTTSNAILFGKVAYIYTHTYYTIIIMIICFG